MLYVLTRLAKGLTFTFLVLVAFVLMLTVLLGPLILGTEFHWAWGLLYLAHLFVISWQVGEEF